MTNQEAVKLTEVVFDAIQKATTIHEIEKIADSHAELKNNKMQEEKYPKIMFGILPEEIRALEGSNTIDNNFYLSSDISSRLSDPLTKLLYAVIWKNGDLRKINHIIKGILSTEGNEYNQEKSASVVFYQFGRHLAHSKEEPIIDQHVIRAFGVFKGLNLRHLKTVTGKDHKKLINEYKLWLTDALKEELKCIPDYKFHIDRLLYSLGKAIKISPSEPR